MGADYPILLAVAIEDLEACLQPNPLVHFVQPAVDQKADSTVFHHWNEKARRAL